MMARRMLGRQLLAAVSILFIIYQIFPIRQTLPGVSTYKDTSSAQHLDTTTAETATQSSKIKRFWPIIDGQIFAMQNGRPGGISIVWKNLAAALSSQLSTARPDLKQVSTDSKYVPGRKSLNFYWDKIFYIDKALGSSMSNFIRSLPGVVAIDFSGGLDTSIQSGIIDQFHLKRKVLSEVNSTTHDDPILVFFDTYYDFPRRSDVCKVMMYHDLIPENVGLYHGPRSEYYPRIEQLTTVDSIVSVSHSTARDLIKLYPKKVQTDQDENKKDLSDYLSGTVISVVHNRISPEVFPGPASSQNILEFRKKYSIKASIKPMFAIDGVPYDFLLTVGTGYDYKNFATLFAALDQMPDKLLEKFILLVVGRGDVSNSEAKQVTSRPLIMYTSGSPDGRQVNSVRDSSAVPLRVQILTYVDESDLAVVYSASIGLIYISLHEGFGLPLAEALTCGTLAVASDTSSLPEVGGSDDITYYTPSKDIKLVRDSMVKLVSLPIGERLERIKKGRKWVEQFGGSGQSKNAKDLGWNDMARGIMWHVANSNKHRGDSCYNPVYTDE